MRNNKINNVDLFTQSANDYFKKHIKTQSKQALEIIDRLVDWKALRNPWSSQLSVLREAANLCRFWSWLSALSCSRSTVSRIHGWKRKLLIGGVFSSSWAFPAAMPFPMRPPSVATGTFLPGSSRTGNCSRLSINNSKTPASSWRGAPLLMPVSSSLIPNHQARVETVMPGF